MKQEEVIRLTSYSHGAGCGCKISPAILSEILAGAGTASQGAYPGLLVGNAERDDAAVHDLGDGTAIISTTDFFMPIVDDPVSFGRIASANALSDVYAMGGVPMVAIAILGWPVDVIPHAVAGSVLEGAQATCAEAGIPLAGGHSIDNPEPVFGLAVTGRVDIEHLKRNAGAQVGDLLYLTKPLGVGILSTAQKQGLIRPGHHNTAHDSMIRLNSAGVRFGRMPAVHAMTDVTGFGIGGHLLEMCQASQVGAEIWFEALPLLHGEDLPDYVDKGCVPGGTKRNYHSFSTSFGTITEFQQVIVFDPQTSGGLLIAVDPEFRVQFEAALRDMDLPVSNIGKVTVSGVIQVI